MSEWADDAHVLFAGYLTGHISRDIDDPNGIIRRVYPIVDEDGVVTPEIMIETRGGRRYRMVTELVAEGLNDIDEDLPDA